MISLTFSGENCELPGQRGKHRSVLQSSSVQAGRLQGLHPAFIEITKCEELSLYYEFTANGDEVFCSEGYAGAAGALDIWPTLDRSPMKR
jgi:hypothetical protein